MKVNINDIEHYVLSEKTTISSCIDKFNHSLLKTFFIVNEKNFLLGSITRGDIRRGLLNFSKSDLITKICNSSPFVLNSNIIIEPDIVSQIMELNNIHDIPKVDSNGILIAIYSGIDKRENTNVKNTFFILAGGKGTRMLPLTKKIPKPMAEINGAPILEHIILKAKNEGFINFVISLGYLGQLIKDYFKDGIDFGVKISYVSETSPLGTAGSLSLVENKMVHYPILVSNGDVISNINFRDILSFHTKKNSFATMAVKPFEIQNPFGVIKTKNQKIIDIREKPIYNSLINGGVYILSKEAKNLIPKNFFNMTTLFSELIEKKKDIFAYNIFENWNDIANINQLEIINKKNE